MSGNNMLRRRSRPKWEEVTDGWRKLHNEELHNFYSSVFKTTRIRWIRRVARMGEMRNSHNIFVRDPGGDNLKDLCTDLKIILKLRLRNDVPKCGPDSRGSEQGPTVTISVSTRTPLHGATQFRGREDTACEDFNWIQMFQNTIIREPNVDTEANLRAP
jgi:hypothetical protein